MAAFEILQALAVHPGDPDIPREEQEPAVQRLIQRQMVKADQRTAHYPRTAPPFVDYYANLIGPLISESPARELGS